MNNEVENKFSQNHSILSYYLLRQLIGWLGIFLSLGLILGSGLLTAGKQWFQLSISAYYYSVMHVFFIGGLFLLGAFLLTNTGPGKFENLISKIAGICAFGVASFPTSPNSFIGEPFINLNWHKYFNLLHWGFASILLSSFAIFCFIYFQNADDGTCKENFDVKKKRRNVIYKLCGCIIIISILLIAILSFWVDSKITDKYCKYYTIFFETTSLVSFGISWLLKGSGQWPNSKFNFVKKGIQFFR